MIKQPPIEFIKFCPNILIIEHSGKETCTFGSLTFLRLVYAGICAYSLHLSHVLEGHVLMALDVQGKAAFSFVLTQC